MCIGVSCNQYIGSTQKRVLYALETIPQLSILVTECMNTSVLIQNTGLGMLVQASAPTHNDIFGASFPGQLQRHVSDKLQNRIAPLYLSIHTFWIEDPKQAPAEPCTKANEASMI